MHSIGCNRLTPYNLSVILLSKSLCLIGSTFLNKVIQQKGNLAKPRGSNEQQPKQI